MKTITKILLISITVYSIVIGLTLYLGDLWVFLTFIAVLGLGYDIHSYIRLRKGKPIITLNTVINLFKKKPEVVTLDNGFYIGDKHNRRRQDLDKEDDERRWFCASCRELVDKVTWDEERENDFCDDCY
jgi:hypothetical protein